jgi:hypothetical protein
MTFYIKLAFTSGLALRIKGAAYFTKSQRSETDNKAEQPAECSHSNSEEAKLDGIRFQQRPLAYCFD